MTPPRSKPSPQPTAFPADGLRRLAELILGGDVVFFIGAGFSLDSEKNFASRLISRLLIRLLALGRHLGEKAVPIRDALRSTFDLGTPDPSVQNAAFPFTRQDLSELGRKYYEINDWFCRAFAEFLRIAASFPETERPSLLQRIHREEEAIRTRPNGPSSQPLDPVPLDVTTFPGLIAWVARGRISSPLDDAVPIAAGKSLFLDTMGFRDDRVMAGNPWADSLQRIAESYGSRLLPRHQVIARLARDGLCTTTVTPNFDLLLEGAFRLAGFADRASSTCQSLPSTHFSEYARITSPSEFFREGKAHRTAVLVKMHGCAGTYRNIRLPAKEAFAAEKRLGAYLKSMVFTYREIQNWREDAWAADFLRTLLRTRTVVFAGYSLQDPVVHDTFRTVYEEMARIRRADRAAVAAAVASEASAKTGAPARPGPDAAPAFFFDVVHPASANKKPFHALEVLNAASDAVGAPRADFGRHPNFLRFHARGSADFPNLDEISRWLVHLVLRFRQRECLANDLQRTLTALHGSARPEVEIQNVQRLFLGLVRRELGVAETWAQSFPSGPPHALHRRQLGRICSWSESFHVALLREFAAVDQLRRKGGLGAGLADCRRLGWYYPMMQDAGWTCWTAVVELAVRRMIRRFLNNSPSGQPSFHPAGSERVWAAAGDLPTVLFLRACPYRETRRTPRPDTAAIGETSKPPPDAIPILQAISIRFDGFDRVETASAVHGQPARTCIWLLRDKDAPWRPTPSGRPRPGTAGSQQSGPWTTPSPTSPDWEGPDAALRRSGNTVERRPPPASVLWRWASRTETARDRSDAAQWLGIPHA
ncbi:MAG: SIR2 family protein [Limisphaerales bacterium]